MNNRTLADWLSYLEQLHPSAIDMGLERVQQVADQLGLGKPAPLVITVTGTNGKGSTCAFIEALLKTQGLKVGVYSSPHLLRYNERVRMLGVDADDAADVGLGRAEVRVLQERAVDACAARGVVRSGEAQLGRCPRAHREGEDHRCDSERDDQPADRKCA